MEQYQKDLSKEWGVYMRTPYRAYPRRSVLGRIQDEGPGASVRKWGGSIPVTEFCPRHLQFIHKAWRESMTDRESTVFYLRFVAKGSPSDKARAAGVNRSRFYEILGNALAKIEWDD